MTHTEIEAQPLQRIQELAEAQRILARARLATADGPGMLPYKIVFHASQYIAGQIDELLTAEIGDDEPGEMRGEDPARTSAHGRPGWNG